MTKIQKRYLKRIIDAVFTILIVLWAIAAWVTHVTTCLAAGTWGFLIAGAIAFPIAFVHGTWIWFT
jgi:hypothetical protein